MTINVGFAQVKKRLEEVVSLHRYTKLAGHLDEDEDADVVDGGRGRCVMLVQIGRCMRVKSFVSRT
jgi:hypothetical protein